MERMVARTKHYSIIGGELYKSGIVAPMLKCINKQQSMQLLDEVRQSMWSPQRPHEIAHRALRQGFYWPSTAEDAKELVHTCENYQMFTKHQRKPANPT